MSDSYYPVDCNESHHHDDEPYHAHAPIHRQHQLTYTDNHCNPNDAGSLSPNSYEIRQRARELLMQHSSRYNNNIPQISSLSRRFKSSPSPTTVGTASTSSFDTSPSISPQHQQKRSQDEFSIDSALSLYQAFASGSISSNDDVAQNSNCNLEHSEIRDKSNQLAVMNHNIDDTTYNSNSSIGEIDEVQSVNDRSYGSNTNNESSIIQCDNAAENCRRNKNDDDDDDESSTTSSSVSSTPNNPLLSSYTTLIIRHRKKLGTIACCFATLWAYTQYHKSSSKQMKRSKRYYTLQNELYQSSNLKRHKILGMYRWLIKLISSLRISKHLQQMLKTKYPTTSSQNLSAWTDASTTPLSHLLATVKTGNISKVLLRGSVLTYLHSSIQSSSTGQTQKRERRWSKTALPSNNPNVLNEIISNIMQNGCDDISSLPDTLWQRFLNGPALVALPFAYLGALYWIMRRLQRQQLEGDDSGDSWKNNGSQQHVTTFDDVAGIDSSLQELSEIISYMRNPTSFHSVGAQPPRGILLHGPPGSGKTLLARAIAGEAERCADGTPNVGGNTIDCFAVCSGSEFVETYVGRGAARVRGLFHNVREEAMKNFKRRQKKKKLKRWNTTDPNNSQRGLITRTLSEVSEQVENVWEGMQSLVSTSVDSTSPLECRRPMAIIFIDEIDALAKRRDSGIGLPSSLGGGGCDEREQTLNQLLTEMDGFLSGAPASAGVNVIVIAATNRPEVLDPAILRAGRFDRHVQVTLPDAHGREDILRVHARRIRLGSVNFSELPTHNFSGAELKNVINEAALLAVRNRSSEVTQDHLLEATQKVRAMARGHLQQFMR